MRGSTRSNDEERGALLSRKDLLREAAFVDGEWVSGVENLPVISPATEEEVGVVPRLGRAHAVRAVEAASRALPLWRTQTAQHRGAILRRWFEKIMLHAEDLATLLTMEQGKPLAEARGEITYAASFVEWFAEEGKRAYGDVIPGHQSDKRLVVVKQPVGVVAAITPWNFPAAMITRKVAPALAAGCTVVLKPSELTPFTALALALLGAEAGVPQGVFNVVTGNPQEIGDVLTTDPRVRKFSFTGSTAVGKMLAARCMGTVKRVSLELGGNAPFIVFDDADLDRAVNGAMASKFRNAGQTCVCANRILVQSGIYDEFAARFADRAKRLIVGNGLQRNSQVGPLINERAREKVRSHVEDAVALGARVLTGSAVPEGRGYFFEPTVLTEMTDEMRMFHEETFGPVAGLTRFDRENAAIDLANNTSAGLAAYVYTRDASRTWRMGEALDYGMVGLNTGMISTEVAPFGGMKESGLGREGSRYGLDEYLDIKMLCSEIAPD